MKCRKFIGKKRRKTVRLKIRNIDDLIQKAQHLIHPCSEKEHRENKGDKVIYEIGENVPELKVGSRDSYLKCY